jgi:hypothetical protein
MCLEWDQVVRLQPKAYLQKLLSKRFPKRVVMNRSKQYLCVLWLKCRNMEGVSGEHQKLRSAGQEGQVLNKHHVRHPFSKLQDIWIRTRHCFSLVFSRSELSLACPNSPATCLFWPIFVVQKLLSNRTRRQNVYSRFNLMF